MHKNYGDEHLQLPFSALVQDGIIPEFNISEKIEPTVNYLPVTFWIPVEQKQKYDRIQAKTHRRFGKYLRDVLSGSISRVKEEAG